MNIFTTAIKMFLLMTVLTGFLYPMMITGIAQLLFSEKANGSLILHDKKILGSALIAQKSSEDKYFHPRPSAIDYNPIAPSGGSNLGPTSKKLKNNIDKIKSDLGNNATNELLFASGSGLDPHIDLMTAYYQIPRVAKARSMKESDLRQIVDSFVEGKQFGFIGPEYVNVLKINKAMDDR